MPSTTPSFYVESDYTPTSETDYGLIPRPRTSTSEVIQYRRKGSNALWEDELQEFDEEGTPEEARAALVAALSELRQKNRGLEYRVVVATVVTTVSISPLEL